MSSGPGSSRPTSVVLPGIEADPLFADAVDDAIAGDASTMPGILDRPVGRDPHDFSSLYVRHRSSFVAHARRYLNDQRDIDEVVQEALLRLFLALPELETELQALAYCRRTVTNLCIDRFRAQARRPRMVGYDEATDVDLWDDGNVDDPIYAAEDAAIVREALALLSPAHRDALIKREVEEKSLAQIALEMGIPETAVKHTLHRARRSLRRTLAVLWAESGQGVKSALVLILAILVGLPFIPRGGGAALSTSALQAPTSVPTAGSTGNGQLVPAPGNGPHPATNDGVGIALPQTPTGSAKWPTVPQLSLPQVSVPAPVATPTSKPTSDPTGTGTPTHQPVVPPADGPKLSVRGTYTFTAGPSIQQHTFSVQNTVGTQVSTVEAVTTQGTLAVATSVTRFTDVSMDVAVAPSLPLAGASIAAAATSRTYNAQVAADGSVTVTTSSTVSVSKCDIPQDTAADAVVGATVVVDLHLTSDLASVVAEHVRVIDPLTLAGSVDVGLGCGGSTPALPDPTDGTKPTPSQPSVSTTSVAKVEEQVTSTF